MVPPIPEPASGLNAAVAAELRAAQARRRLSIPALSEMSEIPYGSLRRYLNAERHIDIAVLSAIATALDTSIVEIVTVAQAQLAKAEADVARPQFGAGRRAEDWQQVDDEAAWDEGDH